MKEYKVINWKPGLGGNTNRLEDTLNQYAQSGWVVCHIAEQSTRIVFERNKNR